MIPIAQAIDSFWFADVSFDGSTVRFYALTEAAFQRPLRICFRGIPEGTTTLDVTVNGISLGKFAPRELHQGIEVSPVRVPSLMFAPPPEIRHRAPWQPRARIHGPPEVEWKAHVELLTPRGSEKIPLALSPGGDLLF